MNTAISIQAVKQLLLRPSFKGNIRNFGLLCYNTDMQLNLKKNNKLLSRITEIFLTVAEDVKAVYEISSKKSNGAYTRVYMLTNLKIIYVELSKNDTFVKCYPLNKNITYQIECEGSTECGKENILKAKIQITPDSSIIFSFDKERDDSGYYTSLALEREAGFNFIIQLNNLLAEI